MGQSNVFEIKGQGKKLKKKEEPNKTKISNLTGNRMQSNACQLGEKSG